MPGPLRAAIVALLLIANTAIWGTLIVLFTPVKFLVIGGEPRRRIILLLAWFAERWVAGNDAIFDRMLTTRWEIEGVDTLRHDAHYLIISNHISWVDIFVLFRVFRQAGAPFIRFFLKHALIYSPIVGQACWALEFPFMRRYSPEYLAKHPEKRGEDLETTRIACRRYRDVPVAILNFVEGTRFSREKLEDQQSPYKHLLRPRVGGISFVLASLGEQLDAVFDMTIVYPGHETTMYDFAANRIDRIVVRARRVAVPPHFISPAATEPGPVRDELKEWIEEIWREKDVLIDGIVQSPA
ncbi:MAG TPA: acyltransferase [Thermoanaerobaculia bacterium]|nr:acyltransferase [Thermoanaerobaculia bacterium]